MRAFFEGRLSGAGLRNQIQNAAVSDSDVEITFGWYLNAGLFRRGDRIRTCDFLVPNQALYRAELRPELIQWSMPVRREPSSGTPCTWDEEDSIT